MFIEKKRDVPNVYWSISGIINSDNYHDFEKEIIDLSDGCESLTIDMSDVPYITSAALRVLLLAKKKVENIVLLNVNNEIKEIFESSGFTDIVKFEKKIVNEEDVYHKAFKDLLKDMVNKNPDKVAYVMGNDEYTWSDIDKCSQIVAFDLSKLGVKKLSHVGLCSANSINWVITFFAIQKLGAISVFLNFNYKVEEMIKASKIADITYVCCGVLPKVENREEYENNIKSSDSKIQYVYNMDSNIDYRKRYNEYEAIKDKFTEMVYADDPSVIIFTSGSTGNPKGVLTSTYNRIISAVSFIEYSKANENDIMCLYLPLFHALAFISILIVSLLKNIKVCICPNTKIESIIKTIYEHKCTYFVSVPTMLVVMMHNKEFSEEKVKTLRYTMVGGEPIPEENIYEIQKKFVNNKIGILYAMSEVVPISMTSCDDDITHIAKTVGKISEGVKVRIMNLQTGKECKQGEAGEITVYSETAMLGYYKLEIDKQAIDDVGWVRTGDVGLIDEEGYLRITGRCKELIIRAGENISPNEIAEVILKSKEFIDCKVIGVPDDTFGEAIAAVVIMKEGYTFDENKTNEFLADKLAKYKIPAYYIVINEFPYLSNGKIDMVTLKKDVIQKIGKC